MSLEDQLKFLKTQSASQAHVSGRRAYVNLQFNGQEEKHTQTDVEFGKPTVTRFITPRLVLTNEETTNSPFSQAFQYLCKRIRSSDWKTSLLVILGHDPEKHRDELEIKIREDAAAEAIDSEVRVFFDTVLAPVMQERETTIVNTIHECVQQELQAQQLVIQTQYQRLTQLSQEIEEREKQVEHLKAKVDRRVAENNALRKEQYRQLLMLRELMSKHGTEPGALSALNEALTTVLTGKQQTLVLESRQSNNDDLTATTATASGRSYTSLNTTTHVLHREKEKWEQRAREADVECQELRDTIAQLTQENLSYQVSSIDSVPWFLNPENAITERQRIADAVCSYQGKWEDIGDALVELLNNDLLWSAVEQSARRGGKRRVARGLEAVLVQIESKTHALTIEEEAKDSSPSLLGRKPSTNVELGRLLPCRACDGVGYLHPDQGDSSNDDSYLRKTLEQVLELKTQLEKVNTKTLALAGQLQLEHRHSAQLQAIIHQAQEIKTSAKDICLQTDLDDEEGLDLDEIMRSAYDQDTTQTVPRHTRRSTQYEHLIVELKSTLAVKDGGLAENRRALEVAQSRINSLQRSLQTEKDTHAQELATLKTSLAFSLKTRNSKIEERQAAVKLVMEKFAKKTPQPQPTVTSTLSSMNECEQDEDCEEDVEDDKDTAVLIDTIQSEQNGEQHEVKRMEMLAQRYAEDIVRVRKEYEMQQTLLQKAEAEMAEETGKRSRTNSILQGNVVVSLASHPRDLFNALSTAQTDMSKLRRASQRSSALQTDRLLTLTTHLGHMSEELCTLRKRNLAELEYWKLECEKLQNTNKALQVEQQLVMKQLKETKDDQLKNTSSGVCSTCEKHKKRLLQISKALLNQSSKSKAEPELEVPAASALTESDRQLISNVLMDLESIYTGMTVEKQRLTRELVATYLGNALSPRSRRTTLALPRLDAGSNTYTNGGGSVSTRSPTSSPRKSLAGITLSRSSSQLRRTGEVTNDKVIPSSSLQEGLASNQPESVAKTTENTREMVSRRRKTLVQELVGGNGVLQPKNGSTGDVQMSEIPEIESELNSESDSDSDNNAQVIVPQRAHSAPLHQRKYETRDADDEDAFTLKIQQSPNSNDIEREPEVLCQLRHLFTESSEAKESLALSSWKIFVLRLLFLVSEQRLYQLQHTADMPTTDETLCPTTHKVASMCTMMAKIVKQRKKALNAAISAREFSRSDLKKAQACLIHGVATLLDNLSGKGKRTIQLPVAELPFLNQGSSPRRSPTNNRLFYPATKVHLNCIPQTQKIPTTTFPAAVGSTSDHPSSSKCREGKKGERSSSIEGSQPPHRLIKSAGSRPFQLIHSSIGPLQGSTPFPDFRQSDGLGSGSIISEGSTTVSKTHMPVRPHSSPAGQRFTSPRNHDLIPSTTLVESP